MSNNNINGDYKYDKINKVIHGGVVTDDHKDKSMSELLTTAIVNKFESSVKPWFQLDYGSNNVVLRIRDVVWQAHWIEEFSQLKKIQFDNEKESKYSINVMKHALVVMNLDDIANELNLECEMKTYAHQLFPVSYENRIADFNKGDHSNSYGGTLKIVYLSTNPIGHTSILVDSVQNKFGYILFYVLFFINFVCFFTSFAALIQVPDYYDKSINGMEGYCNEKSNDGRTNHQSEYFWYYNLLLFISSTCIIIHPRLVWWHLTFFKVKDSVMEKFAQFVAGRNFCVSLYKSKPILGFVCIVTMYAVFGTFGWSGFVIRNAAKNDDQISCWSYLYQNGILRGVFNLW